MDPHAHREAAKAAAGPVAGGMPVAFDWAAETERLLSGRTRDIRLKGEMLKLYREQSWRQRSKIVRSWMIWVTFLSFAVVALNSLVAPELFWISLLVSGCIIPIANLCAALVWTKPRHPAVEGLTAVGSLIVAMLAASILGAAAGGYSHERYPTAGLFVVTIAIVVFGIDMVWVVVLLVSALALFFAVELMNPALDVLTATAVTFFYGMGTSAVLVTRRAMTILAHKSFLMALRDRHRSEALAEANRALKALATIDSLTGLENRRSMTERLAALAQGDRSPQDIAILMCDIDHFKGLNDSLGHMEGDRCLREVAQAVARCLRPDIDCVARFGGEEFLVLMTGVDRTRALAIAQEIRQTVAALRLPNPGSRRWGHVTISIGVAVPAGAGVVTAQLQRQADEALYLAKAGGRDRVVLYEPRLTKAPDTAEAQARAVASSAA